MGKSAYFHFAFTLLLILTAGCQPGSKESTPVVGDLRVEYMTNPLGVDLSRPRFSWKIISQERGVAQGSWRIIVGKSLSEVRKGQGSQWDSGRKEGDVTINHEYAGAPLEDHTTYYWRVKAKVNGVWSGWKPVWQFTSMDPLAKPLLLSPEPGAIITSGNTPTLDWDPVTNGFTYLVQISKLADFSTTYFKTTTDKTEFLTNPLPKGKYYWRVRAIDASGGKGPWSEVRWFKIVVP